MSETEIAWAAGLWDGEGCTSYRHGQFIISMGQKTREVLDRFQLAVGEGVGKVYGPYPQGNTFQYRAQGANAHRALEVLWPYLSTPKREQALEKGFRTLNTGAYR